MSTLTDIVERALADPLGAARAHARSGGRAIGYVGNDIPVELILAASALPIRLTGRPDPPTPNADRFLESSFPPEIRSVAEQWLTGELDSLEAVVFPRCTDAAQRLYYYLCELQRRGHTRGPRPLIYDLARIRRSTSRAYTIDATIQLAKQLGATSNPAEAVSRVRQRRALLCELRSQRAAQQSLAGSTAQRVFRASELVWTSEFDQVLTQWLDQSQAAGGRRQYRLLLAGSTPPDERLHLAVEAAGATIVDELGDGTLSMVLRQARVEAPTLEALGKALHESGTFAQRLLDDPAMLATHANQLRVHGAIVWMIEEDEGIAWEFARQVARLKAAGIPVLSLAREQWAAPPATLDAVALFVRTLAVAS